MIAPAFVVSFSKNEGEEYWEIVCCLFLLDVDCIRFLKGIELLILLTSFTHVSLEECVYSLMSDDLLA